MLYDDSVNNEVLQLIAERTTDFSGAELAELFRSAIYDLANETLTNPNARIDKYKLFDAANRIKLEKKKKNEAGINTRPMGFSGTIRSREAFVGDPNDLFADQRFN